MVPSLIYPVDQQDDRTRSNWLEIAFDEQEVFGFLSYDRGNTSHAMKSYKAAKLGPKSHRQHTFKFLNEILNKFLWFPRPSLCRSTVEPVRAKVSTEDHRMLSSSVASLQVPESDAFNMSDDAIVSII
jgi:hypothetical protein